MLRYVHTYKQRNIHTHTFFGNGLCPTTSVQQSQHVTAVVCDTCFSVLISMSVFHVFHIPSKVCTRFAMGEWVHYSHLQWVHYIHLHGHPRLRSLIQLSGQLNALSALPSEKDTPGSVCIESGLWRRAVSSPRERSIPVRPVAWLLRLRGKVYKLPVDVHVWTSRKFRGCCVLSDKVVPAIWPAGMWPILHATRWRGFRGRPRGWVGHGRHSGGNQEPHTT
jgi:hypothetical protein